MCRDSFTESDISAAIVYTVFFRKIYAPITRIVERLEKVDRNAAAAVFSSRQFFLTLAATRRERRERLVRSFEIEIFGSIFSDYHIWSGFWADTHVRERKREEEFVMEI